MFKSAKMSLVLFVTFLSSAVFAANDQLVRCTSAEKDVKLTLQVSNSGVVKKVALIVNGKGQFKKVKALQGGSNPEQIFNYGETETYMTEDLMALEVSRIHGLNDIQFVTVLGLAPAGGSVTFAPLYDFECRK
ncbi:MAG: hypothetical protein KUL82_13050 [Bdellovibrio sp.]|nr:hypothetical protein [Bdellovibrio sp.]